MSKFFMSNSSLKFSKNLKKAKQHPRQNTKKGKFIRDEAVSFIHILLYK